MANITCLDSAGGDVLSRVTQWDKNRTVYIGGITSTHTIRFYFCNRESDESVAVTPTISSGYYIATIPNALLQSRRPVILYICEINDSAVKTIKSFEIYVDARVKPADY